MTEEKKEEQKVEKIEEPKDLKPAESEKPTEEKVEPKVEEKSEPQKPKVKEEPAEKPVEKKEHEILQAKPAPTGKFANLIKDIESLSVLELSELVKGLEDRFGVSASVPMTATTGAANADDDKTRAAVEEKSKFNIELTAAGDQKINVIKIVREITGVGLKDAKDMVDAAPKTIKENIDKAEAEELKKKLEDAGATVELK